MLNSDWSLQAFCSQIFLYNGRCYG
uniref:Uncharacterized protein n=1 Tax=Anguilla anguilla TaxID=7936 RepID=A0A0E9SY05_ANGAN